MPNYRLIGSKRTDFAAVKYAPIAFLGDNYRGTEYRADFSVEDTDDPTIRPQALLLIAAPEGTDPAIPLPTLLALPEDEAPRYRKEVNRRTGDFTVKASGAAVERPFQAFYLAEYA